MGGGSKKKRGKQDCYFFARRRETPQRNHMAKCSRAAASNFEIQESDRNKSHMQHSSNAQWGDNLCRKARAVERGDNLKKAFQKGCAAGENYV